MHGLLERPRWTEGEIGLLTHFYGRFPAAYISEDLRCSQRAIHTYAHRHALKGYRSLRASEEARARFWAVRQHYIRDSPYHWVQEDPIHQVLDLLWRPAEGVPSCRDCSRLPECRARSVGPLPCERLTVRESLEHL
jgi:hypothetical protein